MQPPGPGVYTENALRNQQLSSAQHAEEIHSSSKDWLQNHLPFPLPIPFSIPLFLFH